MAQDYPKALPAGSRVGFTVINQVGRLAAGGGWVGGGVGGGVRLAINTAQNRVHSPAHLEQRGSRYGLDRG